MFRSQSLTPDAPGGPEGSPDVVFVAVRPRRALYVAMFGMKGRETWSALS